MSRELEIMWSLRSIYVPIWLILRSQKKEPLFDEEKVSSCAYEPVIFVVFEKLQIILLDLWLENKEEKKEQEL